jgi:hypothetical protein
MLDLAYCLMYNLFNIDDDPDFSVLTPWSRVLLEKPTVIHLLKNFPAFYGNRRFITVFTRARNSSLSWVRWIHSIPPHCISLRSILILFSYLRLGIPNSPFLLAFPPKTCVHSSSPHTYYMSYRSIFPWLDDSNYVCWRVKFMKLLIMQFFPTSYYLILLRPKYSLQHPLLKCSQPLVFHAPGVVFVCLPLYVL